MPSNPTPLFAGCLRGGGGRWRYCAPGAALQAVDRLHRTIRTADHRTPGCLSGNLWPHCFRAYHRVLAPKVGQSVGRYRKSKRFSLRIPCVAGNLRIPPLRHPVLALSRDFYLRWICPAFPWVSEGMCAVETERLDLRWRLRRPSLRLRKVRFGLVCGGGVARRPGPLRALRSWPAARSRATDAPT